MARAGRVSVTWAEAMRAREYAIAHKLVLPQALVDQIATAGVSVEGLQVARPLPVHKA